MQKLVTIAGLMLVMFSCNSFKGSPKESLSKFLAAMENNDFDEAKKYATDESQQFLGMLENHDETQNIYSNKKFDITNVEINGNDAKAEVKAWSGATVSFALKYQHDGWKVAFNMSSILDMVKDAIKKEGVDIDKEVNKAIDSVKINLDSLP
jgi:hypothetical protein